MFPSLMWLLVLLLALHIETDTDPEPSKKNIEADPEPSKKNIEADPEPSKKNIEAEFAVTCSKKVVDAEVGGIATLECGLAPPMNAESMNITYNRSNITVHQYLKKKDNYSTQDPHYQGRTTLIKDCISNGIVGLQIHNITSSDEGNYTITFMSRSFFNSACIVLKVTDRSCPRVSCGWIYFFGILAVLFAVVVTYFCTKKCYEEAGRGGAKVKGEHELLQADVENQNNQNETAPLIQQDGPAPFTEVPFILDKDSASTYLEISSDQKRVKFKGNATPSKTVKERQPVAFGKDGFTQGKYLWKVHVGKAKMWALGVAEASVDMTMNSAFLEKEGVCAVGLAAEGRYEAFTSPLTNLCLDPPPETLMVYLDIEGEQLSFYNADNRRHIYSYMVCFQEKVFPFIRTMDRDNWITVSPPSAADTSDRLSEPI
ncbi:hypothetical protein NDU88_001483 [Pleurodeles waltl]|uniref:B30.2/SPRY domain-containing protein n=3 Tax=Pleurodeles waltl TaxID=8319 RepID=A0AAV7Q676_PLEWA|nr:hypothetical protein NDU88_001483 [Pleurodeles waltl]